MPFSPKEIEEKDFLVTIRGYDKDEVRAFLSAIASDYEIAVARAEDAEKAKGKPFETLGNELGHVLQAAKDSADHLRKNAETEASALRQRTEQEARQLREATTQAAQKLREEAERLANETRAGAEQWASQLKGKIKKETDERVKESARRVQRLQIAEAKIRERFESLQETLAQARGEFDSAGPTEDAETSDVAELAIEPGEAREVQPAASRPDAER